MQLLLTASALLAMASAHPTARDETTAASKPKVTDVDILQYALTLEHLEAKFYREGLAKYTAAQFATAGFDATFYNNLKEISYDETSHVTFLTNALKAAGAKPVRECVYEFGITSPAQFVATASILEGVGLSAYLGAAASIAGKPYLTAAGSILTVESRHSAYLRASEKESPFPQAFDAPLDFDQVYTLAAAFIVRCPADNAPLPFKAFPGLTVTSTTPINSGATITLKPAKAVPTAKFAAWVSVTGTVFTRLTPKGANSFDTTVPPGFHGQTYAILTKTEALNDDNTLAGPAIIEVKGTQGVPR